MKKRRSDTAEPCLFLYDILFRVAGVLFLLVMLSVWLICGMFAKYVVTDENSDSARVAAFASIGVLEHEAKLVNGLYQLTDKEVSENTYAKVIPGVDIPKDPFVRLNGTAEVDCTLYLRVTEEKFPTCIKPVDAITFELTEQWTKVTDNQWKFDNNDDGVHVFDVLQVDEEQHTITFERTSLWSPASSDENERCYKYSSWLIDAPATPGTFGQVIPAVTYEITDDWEQVYSDEKKGVSIYRHKQKLDANTPVSDIPILKPIGDTSNGHTCELMVSEHYNGAFDTKGKPVPFTLKFTAWLVQID